MRRTFRLVSRASNLVLAALLAAAVVIVLAVGFGSASGQYRVVTVLTGSMRPTMAPGDVIVERPIRASAVRVGDVITFHPPNQPAVLVTHRVVHVSENHGQVVVQTKGDANNTVDAWKAVLPAGPVWTRVLTVPRAGYFVVWLHNGILLRALLTLVPLVLLGTFLRSLWRDEPAQEETCPA